MTTDWVAWHEPYADPSSQLSRRRRAVQARVGDWLDALTGAGLPARVVSACAGDGRDVLEVLAARPDDAAQVDVLLVELDEQLAADAASYAREHGLDRVTVRCRDAGDTGSYAGGLPAGLVMLCGVFGNITDNDVRGTIDALPMLCAPRATVLWTRGRRSSRADAAEAADDVTSEVRRQFRAAGFDEVAFDAPEDATWSLGTQRLAVPPAPFEPARRLFTFVR